MHLQLLLLLLLVLVMLLVMVLRVMAIIMSRGMHHVGRKLMEVERMRLERTQCMVVVSSHTVPMRLRGPALRVGMEIHPVGVLQMTSVVHLWWLQ